jgi:hypothetical protein
VSLIEAEARYNIKPAGQLPWQTVGGPTVASSVRDILED